MIDNLCTDSRLFSCRIVSSDLIYLARKIANHITPVHEIEQDGDSFVIKISTPRGTQVMTFKIGEEFEQKVMSYQGDFTVGRLLPDVTSFVNGHVYRAAIGRATHAQTHAQLDKYIAAIIYFPINQSEQLVALS